MSANLHAVDIDLEMETTVHGRRAEIQIDKSLVNAATGQRGKSAGKVSDTIVGLHQRNVAAARVGEAALHDLVPHRGGDDGLTKRLCANYAKI